MTRYILIFIFYILYKTRNHAPNRAEKAHYCSVSFIFVDLQNVSISLDIGMNSLGQESAMVLLARLNVHMAIPPLKGFRFFARHFYDFLFPILFSATLTSGL